MGTLYITDDDGSTIVVGMGGDGPQGATGPGYKATSATSLALASSGSKAFAVVTGLAYSAGARVRATSASDVTKWMEGVVSSYVGTTLTVTMDAKSGTGTFADWNLNLAGEPGSGGGGGVTPPSGTGLVRATGGAFVDPAALLTNTDVDPAAAIAWTKISKAGAVPGDVGAAAASHSHAESDVTGLVSDLAGKAPTTRAIATAAPLTGGGDLSADRTLGLSVTPANPGGAVALQATTPGTAQTGHANLTGTVKAGALEGPLTGNVTGTATPLAHATSHQDGGSDELALDGSQITTGSVAAARLGAHAASHNAGGGDALAIDAAAGTGSLRTLGTASTAACAGNDGRLSDPRAASSIPDGTPALGSVLVTAIAAPATPAAGKGSVYVDSTSKALAVKTDAGAVSHTVKTKAAVASQFLTSISDDGSVTAAQPAAGDVTGLAAVATSGSASDLGTGTLPIARVADGAVTLAKLAPGTAGNLITYDAAGNPAAVATGTAGHVLTSNGPGAAPTMQAAGGGGGGYATIQEEGTGLTQRTTLNFIGNGLTAADNAGATRTDVTLADAGASSAGVVTTGAQTLAGVKTLSSKPVLSAGGQNTASAATSVDGDFWNDSTQKTFCAFEAGVRQDLSGVIFTGTADATVGNSTSELSGMPTGVGTLTLPANMFVAGKTLRLSVRGYATYVNSTTPTLRTRIKLGSTVVIDSGAITLPSSGGSATASVFAVEVLITCRTTGATGTLMGHASCTLSQALSPFNVRQLIPPNTATTTFDTTASAAGDITFQWGTANATNTLTVTEVSAEILK